MKTIHVLDSKTINKIAAGEVIEKPASVVKCALEQVRGQEFGVVAEKIKKTAFKIILK